MKIKVTKNGPYIVSGKIPISEQIILSDKDGNPIKWKNGRKFPVRNECELCRCGRSGNKPFCDGTHHKIDFKCTETSSEGNWSKQNGPTLVLKDNPSLCAGAGFCHRMSGTWNLTKNSDDPKLRKVAIQQACDCPSGRLVACDKKTGKAIENKFPKSIGVIEDKESGISGPLWVRGKIPIESAEGKKYELRNRVTLCRCGQSKNKPFCDATHININFSDKRKPKA